MVIIFFSTKEESRGELEKSSLRGSSLLLNKDNSDNISVPNNDMKLRGTKSGFSITLMNMGSGGRRYEQIFKRAARKWEMIIIGDLPNEPKKRSSSHSWFGDEWEEKVNVDIDDVLIGWAMEDIDGSGKTLGYAGKKSF
jgi:hypothetical protein